MNIRRKLKTHTEVHTGPLNDILFILLLFFLIASTLANPNIIKLATPKAKGDTKAKQTVVVSIQPNKTTAGALNYYVGTSLVNGDSAMRQALIPILDKVDSTNRTIVINADKTVPLESVVAVMRIARDLGAKSVLSVDRNTK
jgi:biopolymer transport protein ExbD